MEGLILPSTSRADQMRVLASFVMQGRSQAVMAIGVLALLSLLFPPLTIFSSAVVALVTLRKGVQDGLFVMLLGTAACALLGLLVRVDVFTLAGFTLIFWVPIWALASYLRTSSSLAKTIVLGLIFGLLVIAFYFVEFNDPVTEWRKLLAPFLENFNQAQALDASQQKILLDILSHWMTGMMAAVFFMQLVISLLLARWWQSLLYYEGGFRREFHELRLPRTLSLVTLAVMLMLLLNTGIGGAAMDYLGMLLMSAYLLQGLAIVHGVRWQLKAHPAWLIALYLLLFIAVPHIVIILAFAGIADAWLDIRSRINTVKGSGGTDK